MFDMPEHFEMLVNENGQGPVSVEEAVDIVCWCGNLDCIKHLTAKAIPRIMQDWTEISSRLEEEQPGFFDHGEYPVAVKELYEDAKKRGRALIQREDPPL